MASDLFILFLQGLDNDGYILLLSLPEFLEELIMKCFSI